MDYYGLSLDYYYLTIINLLSPNIFSYSSNFWISTLGILVHS